MPDAQGAAATPYAALLRRIEAALSAPGGTFRALALVLGVALLLSTPAWERLSLIVRTTPWRVFQEKVEAPLSQPRALEASHSGKTTFRLVVPLVARALHLGAYGVLIVQGLLGVALIALVQRLAARESGDVVAALFVSASLVFGYVGKAAFVDLFCWFDAWAFLFLLAALAARGPVLAFVFASLAAWTDERALIALALVTAFHLAPSARPKTGVPRQALAVLGAAFAYAALRTLLAARYGLYTPTADTGLALLQAQRPLLALSAFTGLEGGWILVLSAAWAWRQPAARPALVACAAGILLLLIVSWSVIDMTRSAAYAFPALFVALRLLAPLLPQDGLRAAAFVSGLVSLLFQDYYLQTGWQQPLLLRLLPS
jgi:hypothetical protein